MGYMEFFLTIIGDGELKNKKSLGKHTILIFVLIITMHIYYKLYKVRRTNLTCWICWKHNDKVIYIVVRLTRGWKIKIKENIIPLLKPNYIGLNIFIMFQSLLKNKYKKVFFLRLSEDILLLKRAWKANKYPEVEGEKVTNILSNWSSTI